MVITLELMEYKNKPYWHLTVKQEHTTVQMSHDTFDGAITWLKRYKGVK